MFDAPLVRLFLVLGLSICCGLAGCGDGSRGAEAGPHRRGAIAPSPQRVATERPIVGQAADVYETTATLEPEHAARIRARASGIVRQIYVEEGDEVEAGALLLRLEDDEQRLALRRAELESEQARREVLRLKEAYQAGALPALDYDTARNRADAAALALEAARLDLDHTRIRAPFGGRIVQRWVDVGARIDPSVDLFELIDPEPLLLAIHIPPARIGRIRPGREVEVRIDGRPEPLAARVVRVSPVVDRQTGTIKVTAELTGAESGVRPGDLATLRVTTDAREGALLVPESAVFEDRGEQIVYRVIDERAHRTPVRTGFADAGRIEILEGLAPTDEVVVRGQRSLRDGAPVEVVPPAVVHQEET